MAWVDKILYWNWVEDREKDIQGKLIGVVPPTPSIKKIDYITINEGITGHEHLLAIGVWDNDRYTPINRSELAFFSRQYAFDGVTQG